MSHAGGPNSGQLDVLFASTTFDKTDYGTKCALYPVNPFNTITALYKTFIHFLETAQSIATIPL